MRRLIVVGIAVSIVSVGCSSQPATGQAAASESPQVPTVAARPPMTDEATIVRAMSAAPADVGANATIMAVGDDGVMRQLRAGTNGFVCMAHPEAMCIDKAWQGWADAWISKKAAPQITGIGIAYMLQGDAGASNIDPFATAQTAGNQWVVTPAHIMVLTPDRQHLDALPAEPGNGPWVMWKGTPYAHIMVPTVPMP